jgi:type II secretory ATPase GspE/PulE/Tfp pilus assembly ATPase PilB-like protein
MANIKPKTTQLRGLHDLPKNWSYYARYYDNSQEIQVKEDHWASMAVIEGTVDSSVGGNPQKAIYIVFVTGEADTTIVRQIISDLDRNNPSNLTVYIGKTKDKALLTKMLDIKKPGVQKISHNNKAKNDIEDAENILLDAMRFKASDLHIESRDSTAQIKLRVFGELIHYRNITPREAQMLGQVYYGEFTGGEEKGSGKGTYRHQSLLEGEFSRTIERSGLKRRIKARMLNLSLNRGDKFDFIARLSDKDQAMVAKPYQEMGFSEDASRMLYSLGNASSGAILTLGITGSGKTTTQMNFVMHERDRSGGARKIITAEEPVEQEAEGITQVTATPPVDGIKSTEDFSFANISPKFMRADPDSLLFGEVRDKESAASLAKGVKSGHLVYATMHTDSPMSVFSRLVGFGLDMESICHTSFMRLIIHQHLIPKLCPHCSRPFSEGEAIPDGYSEFSSAVGVPLSNGRRLELDDVLKVSQQIEPQESLLRALQRKGMISSRDVFNMRDKMNTMNAAFKDDDIISRINKAASANMLSKEDINIRFKGNGCNHCFNGHVGMSPAASILIPDDKFMDLVLSGQVSKAKTYWRASLGGKTIMEDAMCKLFAGQADPRIIESKLTGKIGG